MPAHPEALRQAGAEWLTARLPRLWRAGRRQCRLRGSRHCEGFAAGNSGDKLLLDVDYACPDPALHTRLFVKFSRCLGDPFRDRRAHEWTAKSASPRCRAIPAFPVAVARPYFADFDPASGNGVLITQRIAYGEQGIEPVRSRTWTTSSPIRWRYYRATVTALARLAAAHQAGRLSPEADQLFPFDARPPPRPCQCPGMRRKLQDKAAAIAALHRQRHRSCSRPIWPAPKFAARFAARYAAIPSAMTPQSAASSCRPAPDRAGPLEHPYRQRLVLARCGGRAAGRAARLGHGPPDESGHRAVGRAVGRERCHVWDAHLDELLALFLRRTGRTWRRRDSASNCCNRT